MFLETLKTYSSSIKVDDGLSLDVIGTGSINFKVNFSKNQKINLKIEEALYVPTLSTNLLSIGKLAKKGFGKDLANIGKLAKKGFGKDFIWRWSL